MPKAIAADQVLPPEKPEKCPRALLQTIANQLKTEFEFYEKLEKDAAFRALRIGLLLLRVKDGLKHGEFEPWMNQNISEISRRHCFRFMKFARVFIEKKKLGQNEAYLICDAQPEFKHQISGKPGKMQQLVFDFIGDKSQAELFDEYGIKSRAPKTPGGANHLNRWLRENGLEKLIGTTVDKLPSDVRAVWSKYCDEQHQQISDDRQNQIRAQYTDMITNLATAILNKKTYSHLYKKDLEHLHGILSDCRAEIAGALKIPDEEFRARRIAMIKSAAEKADTLIA